MELKDRPGSAQLLTVVSAVGECIRKSGAASPPHGKLSAGPKVARLGTRAPPFKQIQLCLPAVEPQRQGSPCCGHAVAPPEC